MASAVSVVQLREDLKKSEKLIEKYSSVLTALHRQYTCTVCDILMFEPCVIACGHTFCYSCLLEWFKRHKTCPSCRARVVLRPSLSFQIRETVQMLLDKQELIAEAEGGEDLVRKQKEENELVASHKKQHGHIFPHMFASVNNEAAYEDGEDGVRRCAFCHWEVEGTRCMRCHGWEYVDELTTVEFSEDYSENESDADSGESPRAVYGYGYVDLGEFSTDEERERDDGLWYPSQDSDFEPEDEDQSDEDKVNDIISGDESDRPATTVRREVRRVHESVFDEDEDEYDLSDCTTTGPPRPLHALFDDDDDDDDDDADEEDEEDDEPSVTNLSDEELDEDDSDVTYIARSRKRKRGATAVR